MILKKVNDMTRKNVGKFDDNFSILDGSHFGGFNDDASSSHDAHSNYEIMNPCPSGSAKRSPQ